MAVVGTIMVVCVVIILPILVMLSAIYEPHFPHRDYRDLVLDADDYETAMKITFDAFASFYQINPERWNISASEWWVQIRNEDGKWRRVFFKNFIETMKFRRFKKLVDKQIELIEQQEENEESLRKLNQNAKEFFDTIQSDIDRTRRLAEEERDRAFEEIVRQVKMLEVK